MSAKKYVPPRDRRITNDEFAGWVREAIERRAAGKAPGLPQDATSGPVDRSDVGDHPGLTGEPGGPL